MHKYFHFKLPNSSHSLVNALQQVSCVSYYNKQTTNYYPGYNSSILVSIILFLFKGVNTSWRKYHLSLQWSLLSILKADDFLTDASRDYHNTKAKNPWKRGCDLFRIYLFKQSKVYWCFRLSSSYKITIHFKRFLSDVFGYKNITVKLSNFLAWHTAYSLVKIGRTLDEIWIKINLVPLEAQFCLLSQTKNPSKSHLGKKGYDTFSWPT